MRYWLGWFLMTVWAQASPNALGGEAASSKKLSDLTVTDEDAIQTHGVIDRGVVTKDGVRYRKFASNYGSILVIDTSKLAPHDIEKAMCVPGLPSGVIQTTDSPIVGAESKPGPGDWKTYAALIQQTIRSKCDGTVPMATDIIPHLDLGFTKSLKDKDGDDKEIRVFNRDLGPNVNVGVHF